MRILKIALISLSIVEALKYKERKGYWDGREGMMESMEDGKHEDPLRQYDILEPLMIMKGILENEGGPSAPSLHRKIPVMVKRGKKPIKPVPIKPPNPRQPPRPKPAPKDPHKDRKYSDGELIAATVACTLLAVFILYLLATVIYNYFKGRNRDYVMIGSETPSGRSHQMRIPTFNKVKEDTKNVINKGKEGTTAAVNKVKEAVKPAAPPKK